MAQIDIKQIRGGSQGSILFLGTNSIVSEDFNNLNWDQSNSVFSINGNVKITDGNQQVGYVLTSDSNGVASWQAPGVLNATGSTNLGTYWTSDNELSFMNIAVSQSTGDIRYVEFDTTNVNDVAPGRLSWNSNDGTLDLGLENDVTLQIGQETLYRVKNQTGETISNGRLVSAVGAIGSSGRILASYSIADGSVPARFIMGVATSDILDGQDGYVTHFGLVRGIDSTGTPYGETWSDGDVLWANPNIPGGLTNQEPSPGGNTSIKVVVALVIDADVNGAIFVRVSNGFKLHELHDVEYDESQLTDDSILRWSTTGQYWTYSTNSFENLSDTNIISATTNDTLRYDGIDWVNNSFVTADSAGTFSINGTFVYVDGNQQAGYVLTSDGSGIASWSQSQVSTQSITELTISGTQNGTNRDYVISSTLVYPNNLFFINGQLVNSPSDYIISGTSLTIDSSYPAPIESDSLRLFGTINGIVGGGINSLNGLTTDTQTFTSSSPNGNIDFNINSNTSTHTFTANVLFNDVGTSSTDVWSADQIITYIGSTAASGTGNVESVNGLTAADQFLTASNTDGNLSVNIVSDGSTHSLTTDLSPIIGVDAIDFDLGVTASFNSGRVSYDSFYDTLRFDNTNHSHYLLQEEHIVIYNNTGATISSGTVVYLNGIITDGYPEISLADVSISTTLDTFGIVNDELPNLSVGKISVSGIITGVDTTGTTSGKKIFLSSTPGEFVDTEPNVDVLIKLGQVIIGGTTSGKILVNIKNGTNIVDLSGVSIIGTPSNNSILQYDTGSGVWLDELNPDFNDITATGLTLSGYHLDTSTWTASNILIVDSTTSSVIGSGFTFNDDVISNTTIWSSEKVIDYSLATFGAAHNYAGIVDEGTPWVNNGDGTITLPDVTVALYNNAVFDGIVSTYSVTGGTSGVGGLGALVDNTTNYIHVDYNGGNPIWVIDQTFDDNFSDKVIYLTVFRLGNFLHTLEWGEEGAGLPNKLSERIARTGRFARESGFALGMSGSTGIVTLSGGVSWNGTNRESLAGVNSTDDIFFTNYHVGGTWTYSTAQDLININFYDDGTDRVTASTGSYIVNWYYRGQEINDHLYEVYGATQYASIAEAELSTEPGIPDLISSHAFLVGRIITEVGTYSNTTVGSAFTTVFASSTVTNHEDLSGLLGGDENGHYHLTIDQLNNLAFVNVDNNFSSTQSITGDLNLNGGLYVTGSNISMTFSSGTLTDSSGNGFGLQYTSDYSGTFVTNSLVTKAYVDTNGGGGSSRITSSVQTTNNTPTELEKIISITDNTTSIIEVYIKAYTSSATQYGVWKRTLTVTKVAGVVTIRQVNADVDRTSSGLNANSISFTVNAGDIDLDVTGIAATTIDWESAYEIIL